MTTRIYQPIPLQLNEEVILDKAAAHHLCTVLRMQAGNDIVIFNGEGGEYHGTLTTITKRAATVTLHNYIDDNRQSNVKIHLGQAIARNDKMDYIIQKACELGVNEFTPLITEFCQIKLKADILEKKSLHWQKVVISACEQCGLNIIPVINKPCKISDWISVSGDYKFILNPVASQKMENISYAHKNVAIVVGPEGGLSKTEIDTATDNGFTSIKLGPRILRTETAGLAIIAIVQYLS